MIVIIIIIIIIKIIIPILNKWCQCIIYDLHDTRTSRDIVYKLF